MAKNTKAFVQDFAFYEQLWEYYSQNRGKIRSRYNDLTKKFLAYNDSNENSDAFLREPQFEALEMYVFIKEFMDKKQRVSMQIHIVSTLNQRKNAFYSIFQVIRLRKFILQVCLLPIKVICQCNIMTLSQSD